MTDNKPPSYDPKDPNYLAHVNDLMDREADLTPAEQAQLSEFRDRFSAENENALLKQYADLIKNRGPALKKEPLY